MDLTVGSAVGYGWETFKKRPWFFVGASVVIFFAYLVVGGITSGIDAAVGASPEDPSLISGIVNFVLATFIGMGVVAFYLAAHDNPETVELSALWHPQPFWKFIVASILAGLIVGIGFVLLIVPGVIAAIFFMFATVLVIDRGLGPIDALTESMRIGKGHRWMLLGLMAAIVLIILAGMIALMVGLLVAMPVAMLAFMHAYRVLSSTVGAAPIPADARLAA